jgi:hypothetical protein
MVGTVRCLSRVSSQSDDRQLRRRPTLDLVVLALTVTICVVLLVVTVGVIVAAALGHGVGEYLGALGSALSTVIGALLGLIAGRRSRSSQIGTPPTHLR